MQHTRSKEDDNFSRSAVVFLHKLHNTPQNIEEGGLPTALLHGLHWDEGFITGHGIV